MNRSARILLLVLIGLRLSLFALFIRHPGGAVTIDSKQYLTIAGNLLHHHTFSKESAPPRVPDTVRTPGYPAFLVPILWAFSNPIPWIIAAQLLLGFFTTWRVWKWTERVFSKKAGLTAAIVLGCDWATLVHTTQVMTETLFLWIFTLALLESWRSLDNAPERSWRAGLLWGASILVRPVTLYLPLGLSVLWFKNKKWAIVFLLASYLLPGLWVVRNYRATGVANYTSLDGTALLLYPAAGVEAILTHQPIHEVRERLLQEVMTGLPAGASELDVRNAYMRKANAILRSHPFAVLEFCAHGAARLLGGTGLEMLTDLLGFAPPTPTAGQGNALIRGVGTGALLRTYPILLPLQILYMAGLAWVYFAFSKGLWKLWNAHAQGQATLLLLIALYIVAISSHEGYYRYRIPLMPLLAIGVAASWMRPKDKVPV